MLKTNKPQIEQQQLAKTNSEKRTKQTSKAKTKTKSASSLPKTKMATSGELQTKQRLNPALKSKIIGLVVCGILWLVTFVLVIVYAITRGNDQLLVGLIPVTIILFAFWIAQSILTWKFNKKNQTKE